METDRPRDPLAATTTPVPRGPVPPLHELPRVGSTQDEAAARLSGGVGVPSRSSPPSRRPAAGAWADYSPPRPRAPWR